MPTNEAGLSDGDDLGDGGHTTASDMPAENVGDDAVVNSTESADDDAGATAEPARGTGPGD